MEISQYMDKRKYATKRNNAIVADRKKSGLINYVYTFTGLDEYAGIAFCHKWLEVPTEHELGETVPLLINENNLDEFWFEEAKADYGKYAIVFGALALFVFL